MGVAAIMNTVTFLLLRVFVDHYLVAGERNVHLVVYLAGFLGLAVVQAVCTFNSRRLAAKTAEGIAGGCASISTTTSSGSASPITTRRRRVN
jgi:ABC-type bacteriocin/lantibiotic exporter with double-glycine peptidase domain